MGKNKPRSINSTFAPHKVSGFIKFIFLPILSLVVLLGLAGCVTFSDPEASQDFTTDNIGTLSSQITIGQSFISHRSHLNGITIWISRKSGSAGSLVTNDLSVQLFLSSGDTKPIYSGVITVPSNGTNLAIPIAIPDQNNLAGQNYYIQFANGTNTIQLNGRNADAYPNGEAYINHQPINADLAFRLTYNYGFSALIEDIRSSLPSIWLILPLIIILWLPGWLLLDISGLRPRYDPGEQTALAMGFSLALIPLAMLWTTVIGLKWTSRGIYIVSGLMIVLFVVRVIYKIVSSARKHLRPNILQMDSRNQLQADKNKREILHFLALLLIFFASLLVRLVMVRDLATPAWVDSVHHALITRLILNAGAYPSSYLPYLDIHPGVYHLGFHSIAAVFTWLSQLDLSRSLLIFGQVLNAMTVFSVYLLTKTLTHSSTSGLFAAIITSFLTPMPAYYTSWGRYTELVGLLLLPVIPALLQPNLDRSAPKKLQWIIILGAITAGGLFMVHYRVLAFLACLLIAYVAVSSFSELKLDYHKVVRSILLILMIVIATIILVLPWLIQAIKTALLPNIIKSPTAVPFFQDFAWAYLTSAYGKQSLVLAGLGLIWGIIKPRRFTFMLLGWVFLLFMLANLGALKLPGGGLINNSSVEIMLFIPISIFGGYFVYQLLTSWTALIPTRMVKPSLAIVLIVTAFISYLGARQLVTILNPVTILSRDADLEAINWVRENIPSSETIVINPFAWGYGLYAGNDGGYWISPLAGKQTLPPTVLYGLGSNPKVISQLSQQIINFSSNPASFRDFLLSHQLHFIYLGARGGAISPYILSSSGLFSLLYHQDGVWVFSPKP